MRGCFDISDEPELSSGFLIPDSSICILHCFLYCFKRSDPMKKTVSRLGSAALCVTLSLALGCGCAVMPPASSEKPASWLPSPPTPRASPCTMPPGWTTAAAHPVRLRQLRRLPHRPVRQQGAVPVCPQREREPASGHRDRRDELLVPHLVGLHRPAAAAVPCMTRTAAK